MVEDGFFGDMPFLDVVDGLVVVVACAFQHLFNALEYRGRTGALPWPPVEEAIGMEAVIRTSCGC